MRTKGYISNSVLALAGYYEKKLYPCGSAFLIGDGLAITASHILEKPFNTTLDLPYEYIRDKFSILGFQKIKNYNAGLIWQVRTAHLFPIQSDKEDEDRAIDIALLKIAPHQELIPQLEKYRKINFELNIAPPKIGDIVTAYGFPNSKITVDSDPNSYAFDNDFQKIEGSVTQIFFPHRDTGFLSFPCFEIDADFPHGMSGGPIFNKNGQVCGVISSSSSLNGPSYGSVLWPAMAIKISDNHLLDYAKQNKIHVVNHDSVELYYKQGYEYPGITFKA